MLGQVTELLIQEGIMSLTSTLTPERAWRGFPTVLRWGSGLMAFRHHACRCRVSSNRIQMVLLEAPTLRQWQGLEKPRERLHWLTNLHQISISGQLLGMETIGSVGGVEITVV